MLPETFAPAAEILPSDTVSVELAEGSQLPAFVTMVTFQVPSNGCWAKAEVVTEVVAEVTRPITKKAVPMRLRRMNQIPELSVMGRLKWTKCVQSLPRRNIPDYSKGSKHLVVSLFRLWIVVDALRGSLRPPPRQALKRANLEA
jgi:hypothetical protein